MIEREDARRGIARSCGGLPRPRHRVHEDHGIAAARDGKHHGCVGAPARVDEGAGRLVDRLNVRGSVHGAGKETRDPKRTRCVLKVTRESGSFRSDRCLSPTHSTFARHPLETHGPLGTLIAGLGLGAFYLALTWVNLLLGHMLTPLFLIPITWLMDKVSERRRST